MIKKERHERILDMLNIEGKCSTFNALLRFVTI